MFQSLSDAIEIPEKKAKLPPVATAPPPQPTLQDVQDNLPNFNLQPLDEFDTIDDNILAELMVNFEQSENVPETQNSKPSVVVPVMSPPPPTHPLPLQNQEINTQFNTMNQFQMPRIPMMYFPHSNVTFNYNFGK